MARDYYNNRAGRGAERPRLTLGEAASRIGMAYNAFADRDYFQRSFGYFCVDANDVPGRDGNDLREELYLTTGIKLEGLVAEALLTVDEIDLFTVVEYVFDHVARPDKKHGRHHDFSGCGWHYPSDDPKAFDEDAARLEWRAKVNSTLKFYGDGFELSPIGEVVRLPPSGVAPLLSAPLPPATNVSDVAKVAHAVRIFHLARATREERKQAARVLFDVLEYHHRPAMRTLMAKDEGDLFMIANKFSIRHHSESQRDDYDDAWLTWMFYVNLATVYLVLGRVHGASTP